MDEIKAADYALTPGGYVGSVAIPDDNESIESKVERLSTDLIAAFDESMRLDEIVRQQLERLK